MSNELDELNCLYVLLDRANHDEYLSRIGVEEATKFLNENQKYAIILRQTLQRLKAIDNSKPSEVLESLEVINNYGCGINDNMKFSEVFEKEFNTIKQTLLKSQEQEKVLEIIKEKNVCPRTLKDFIRRLVKDEFIIENYNAYVGKDRAITLEEFDLLKRYFG